MQADEIKRLTAYLSVLFKESDLLVVPSDDNSDQAVVAVNQSFFGRLERIEDEGEISYDFSKEVPDQPLSDLNDYFKSLFNDTTMEVRQRPKGENYFKELLTDEKDSSVVKKSDSSDIYKDKELLGVLFDNEGEGIQIFNMAILDIDLEDQPTV